MALARFFCLSPTTKTPKPGMSEMTASGTKSSAQRQPTTTKALSGRNTALLNSKKKRQTGKEKEKDIPVLPSRRFDQAQDDEWDHTRAGTTLWSWAPLTDSSASRHPPIFSYDGRYVLFLKIHLSQSAERELFRWIVIFLLLLDHLSKYTPV